MRDPFTGLYHTHFREFSPIHNRWLSEDPAGYADGLNLYAAYMGVNGVDPLGLDDYSGYGWGSSMETNIYDIIRIRSGELTPEEYGKELMERNKLAGMLVEGAVRTPLMVSDLNFNTQFYRC